MKTVNFLEHIMPFTGTLLLSGRPLHKSCYFVTTRCVVFFSRFIKPTNNNASPCQSPCVLVNCASKTWTRAPQEEDEFHGRQFAPCASRAPYARSHNIDLCPACCTRPNRLEPSAQACVCGRAKPVTSTVSCHSVTASGAVREHPITHCFHYACICSWSRERLSKSHCNVMQG